MDTNYSYYVMERDGTDSYPRIYDSEDSEHTTDYIYIYKDEKIEDPKVTEFNFAEPFFKEPVIGDYFSQPAAVVSPKIADVLLPHHIEGIQLIPAIVNGNKGEVYEGYFYIHIYHHLEAMDKEKSNYTPSGRSYSIKKFVLDQEALSKIPLQERLIFRLKEDSTKKLIHQSLVDEILKTDPKGVVFKKVEDWRF